MSKPLFEYRIYYEDTDAGEVVYYANYLKFFERARTDLLRSKNINQSELAKKEGLIFIVSQCNVKYLSPARLDDVINVSAEISELKPATIIMKQELSNHKGILATLTVSIVCVDKTTFKPTRIPKTITEILK